WAEAGAATASTAAAATAAPARMVRIRNMEKPLFGCRESGVCVCGRRAQHAGGHGLTAMAARNGAEAAARAAAVSDQTLRRAAQAQRTETGITQRRRGEHGPPKTRR